MSQRFAIHACSSLPNNCVLFWIVCLFIAMLLRVTKWCMVPTSRSTLQYLKCKMPDLWNLKKFHHEANVVPFTASGGAEPKSSCSSHHHQTLRFQGFKASLPGLQGWCRSLGKKSRIRRKPKLLFVETTGFPKKIVEFHMAMNNETTRIHLLGWKIHPPQPPPSWSLSFQTAKVDCTGVCKAWTRTPGLASSKPKTEVCQWSSYHGHSGGCFYLVFFTQKSNVIILYVALIWMFQFLTTPKTWIQKKTVQHIGVDTSDIVAVGCPGRRCRDALREVLINNLRRGDAAP